MQRTLEDADLACGNLRDPQSQIPQVPSVTEFEELVSLVL